MLFTPETAFLPVLLLNLLCCAFMCGLTTFVHVVHYPGFSFIPAESGAAFHTFHANRTAAVVAFPMLAELGAAVALVLLSAGTSWFWFSLAAAALLGFIWFETAFRVIPLHSRLSESGMFQKALIRQLCKANTARTFAWNFRMLLLTGLIISYN